MVSGGCLILGGRDWNSGRWLLYLFGGCYRMSLDWSYEGGFKGNHGFDFDHHFIGLPENIPFNHCQEQRDATSVDEPTICWMGLYKWLGKSLANVWLVVEVGGVDPPRMRFLPLANPKKQTNHQLSIRWSAVFFGTIGLGQWLTGTKSTIQSWSAVKCCKML